MIGQWAIAFLLTQVIEIPIYARAGDRPLRERLAIAFAASAMTHPLVWFVIPVALSPVLRGYGVVAVCEAFAVLAEALWLAVWRVPRPLAWALLANAVSFGIGVLLFWH